MSRSPRRRRPVRFARPEELELRQLLAVVSVAATDPDAAERNRDPGTFTLTRSDGVGALAVVVSLNGTATQDVDYAASGLGVTSGYTTVTFAAGVTTAVVTVLPYDDNLPERDETAVLTVSGPPSSTFNSYTVASSPSNAATVTIHDDDVPTITVKAVDPDASELGPDPGTFLLWRSNPTGPLTVTYTLTGTAGYGAGADYTTNPAASTVTFAAGSPTAVIVVNPVNDATIEGDETVILTLAPAATFGTPYSLASAPDNAATVTIHDDDGPEISVAATDPDAYEAGPDPGVFTLTRTGSPAATLTVTYTLTGTAGYGAGADYTTNPAASTVTFAAGSSTATVAVNPVNDATVEGDETVVLKVSQASGSATYRAASAPRDAATVTIHDDDGPQVSIRATDNRASEVGRDPATFTISRTGSTAAALTVSFTVGGTATNGADYDFSANVTGGSVPIPAGQSSVDVIVTPRTDSLREGTETVILTLGAGGGTYGVAAPGRDIAYIADKPRRRISKPKPKSNPLPAPGTCPFPADEDPEDGDELVGTGTEDTSGGAGDLVQSPGGVNYATGGPEGLDPAEFRSDGYGAASGRDLGWTGERSFTLTTGSPNGVVDAGLPALAQDVDGSIMEVDYSDGAQWFDYDTFTASYKVAFYQAGSLAASAADFVRVDAEGNVFTFYGFGTTLPAAQRGQLKSIADPYGHATTTTYDGSGRLTALVRTDGTTTETTSYTYLASGPNAGLVSGSALRRQPAGGGAVTYVRKASYTYYDGVEPNGNRGDLKLEVVKDANDFVLDTTYYRYYTPGEARGYAGALKFLVRPGSYARLAAAVGDPAAASDAQVAAFADRYFEYDAQQRVSLTTIQGTGCGCAGGLGTYTYTYTTSANVAGYNAWDTRTVETLPDGNTNTVYTNAYGEVMLVDFSDRADAGDPTLEGKHWLTAYKYAAPGSLIEVDQPSAVAGYNDTAADLAVALNAASGRIDLMEYGSTQTATASAAGDVVGYLKAEKVKNGSAGTPVTTYSTQYFARSNAATGAVVYPTATETVYRNDIGTGARTTTYGYTWYGTTVQMASATATLPVVSAIQNGPGTADVEATSYDTYGRPTQLTDAGGYVTSIAYDNPTGAVTQVIVDVNGLHLATTYEVDPQGRTTKTTDPLGHVIYVVYNDTTHEVRTYRGWDATTGTATGPTEVVREDRPGSYVEALTMTAAPDRAVVAGGGYKPTGQEAIAGLQSLARNYTDTAGRVVRSDRYFSLAGVTYSAAANLGTQGVNYYRTTYGFDRNGNAGHVQDATGTAYETLFDALGRPTASYVGTDASTASADGKAWTPGNAGATSNLVKVAAYQYDGGGVGDGNLTLATDYPDAVAANARGTAYAYDWRDRLVAMKVGVQGTEDATTHRPIVYYDLDNLGEVIAVSRYDGDGIAPSAASKPAAGLLRAYATAAYDEQGRPYQLKQSSVDQSTGAVSANALTTNLYYDRRGNMVMASAPGGLVTESMYDGAGRLVERAVSDGAGGAAWSNAGTTTGDHVLTETLFAYDAAGNVTLVTTKDRFHDAPFDATAASVGELGTPASTTAPKARVSYAALYYDAADRPTATVDVGTNGGASYTPPGTVPLRSDAALVTSYTYNAAGRLDTVLDPRGITSRMTYDALGRTTQTIQNYTNGTPTSSSNATTNYTYDGMDHILSVTAVMPAGTPSQTTQYVYGVTTASGSGLNSNDVPAQVRYADKTTGSSSTALGDRQTFTVNALGEATGLTDPNGTVHAYAYDTLGRLTSDAVTTLAAGVDGAVRRLQTAYDAGGRAYLFTSYNAASGGTVVNQVQRTYDGLGQLVAEYQEHSGAVNTSTTPKVQYAYSFNPASGGANSSRLASMTYPNGRVVNYSYGTGLDLAIGRVNAIIDGTGGTSGTHLEDYAYLGLGTIVKRAHPEPNVDLTYIQAGATGDGGDQYVGLDRFGRVADQNWSKAGTALDRVQYGYDRDGNALYKNNLVNANFSELYRTNASAVGDSNAAYDGLGRMAAFARGALSTSTAHYNGTQLDTISTPTRQQSWALDALGNWSGVTTDGTTVTRTANAQDQTATVAGLPSAPAYDAAGNTTSDYSPAAAGTLTFVYDAWDRLVAAKAAGVTQAAYALDALGRRTTETFPQSSTPQAFHLYDSALGQVLEERYAGTATTNVVRQYVWSLGYVNDLVERDGFGAGGVLAPSARLYALQDANHNVTAIVNTSGVVQERYAYDPYGTYSVLTAAWAATAGTNGWRYFYQGGRWDPATGLFQFGARDYVPSQGRWMQRDPLGLAAGDENIYRFVGNNPVNMVDPTGLYGWGAYLGDFFWELPGTIGGTFMSGEAGDSVLGMANGLTDSLNPFGGGIPVGPLYGHDDAYSSGQGVGHGTGFVMNAVLTVAGVSGAVTAIRSVQGASGTIQVAQLMTTTGQTFDVFFKNGQAIVATVEALNAMGVATGAGYNLLSEVQQQGGSGNSSCPSSPGTPKSGKLNSPNATDPRLQDAYKNLWRPQDKNPGGTIGELLREIEAGGPLKHLEKAKGRLRQLLDRIADRDNPLTPSDRAGAERVINDLKDAIRAAEGG